MVKRVFFILSLLALFSCSMTGIFHESELPSMPDDYENIRIPTDNLLLFADLEGKHLSSRTRSSGDGCETVSLESLLDRDAATQIPFESKIVRQIPFIGNKEDKLVMFTKDFHANCDSDSLTVVKIFLIETSDTLGGIISKNVATMIPDVSYIEKFGSESVTFLDKSYYSGIILYSSLDGTLEEIYTYGDGPMERAKVINSEEKEMYGRSMHLSLLHSLPTRAGDSDSDGEVLELDASYCIAEKRNPDDIIGSGGRDFPKIDDRNTVGNGGGGGGLPDPGDMPKDPITYDISLSAGTGGCVSGSGTYPSGSLVVCKAESSQNFCFDRWVGDLKGKKECYTFQIEKNVISTAYFDSMLQPVKKPCLNEETGIMNPLAEMKLAPTGEGATNFIGSTFGYTRTGGTKFHSGIDLYAEPGTPLYAMCDGTISRSERYVTEQPERIGRNKYPPGYSGDVNDAGNRFTLEGMVKGKK